MRLPFDPKQVTIRDLQKGFSMMPEEEDLNMCRWHAWPRGFAGQPALEYAWFGLGCPSRSIMMQARLASLAARYGARALFSEALALERERAAKSENAEQSRGPDSEAQETSGAFRPKGTDEVAPSEGASAEASVHGGDGASQEVPAGAPIARPRRRVPFVRRALTRLPLVRGPTPKLLCMEATAPARRSLTGPRRGVISSRGVQIVTRRAWPVPPMTKHYKVQSGSARARILVTRRRGIPRPGPGQATALLTTRCLTSVGLAAARFKIRPKEKLRRLLQALLSL